jgi:hypothetical protein
VRTEAEEQYRAEVEITFWLSSTHTLFLFPIRAVWQSPGAINAALACKTVLPWFGLETQSGGAIAALL